MKKIYKFYNIKWDTDGVSATKLNLPSSVEMEINDVDFNPETEGADKLSDKFGYCVFGFEYKLIIPPHLLKK